MDIYSEIAQKLKAIVAFFECVLYFLYVFLFEGHSRCNYVALHFDKFNDRKNFELEL